MTLILTAISLDEDRRQVSRWRTIVASALGDPAVAEKRYEHEWNLDHPGLTCKVIDVRPVAADRTGDCVACGHPVALHFDERNRFVRCEDVRMEA